MSGALVTAALVVPLATCFACSNRPAQTGLLPATSPPVAVAPARASAVRSDTGTAAGEARGMTSCVEPYSLEGLKANADAIAFDGVVSDVGSNSVVYRVREWFRGSGGHSVRLSSFGFSGPSDGEGMTELPPVAVGGRYLVVAVDGNVWGCGWTHNFRNDLAVEWRQALTP